MTESVRRLWLWEEQVSNLVRKLGLVFLVKEVALRHTLAEAAEAQQRPLITFDHTSLASLAGVMVRLVAASGPIEAASSPEDTIREEVVLLHLDTLLKSDSTRSDSP